MALQYNSFAIFEARSGRLADDYIANFVFNGFKAKAFSEVYHKFLNPFLVFRGAWNLGEAVEVFPKLLGFKVRDVLIHWLII
jgi:hypothetical protein